MTMQETSIQTVAPRLVPAAGCLIDVRTPGEFAAVHADGARLVPLDGFNPLKVIDSFGPTAGTLYVLCRSGKRAQLAAEKFVAAGYRNVVVVEGGTDAWIAAGLPVVRGRGVISLERQVRIAAGLLVLTGVALGWFVHPGFYGLAAFVGAGLTFAGITDTCGMAMLLGWMPWNTRAGQTCGAK
jgi:rhodanese-related sulfurtransferase